MLYHNVRAEIIPSIAHGKSQRDWFRDKIFIVIYHCQIMVTKMVVGVGDKSVKELFTCFWTTFDEPFHVKMRLVFTLENFFPPNKISKKKYYQASEGLTYRTMRGCATLTGQF